MVIVAQNEKFDKRSQCNMLEKAAHIGYSKSMMRRLFVMAFFFSLQALFPQESRQTVLVPVDVYVGDSAFIRHTFSMRAGLLPADATIDLPVSHAVFAGLEPDYTVTKASLSINGADCLLSVWFTPWKTGNFDIPPFDLAELLGTSEPLMVDIAPVAIASLTKKLNETRSRPPEPPTLIPGTTYILLFACLAVIIVLIPVIIVIVRIKKSNKPMSAVFGPLFYSKPCKKALKRIKKLKNVSDFAGELEAIVREYLEAHFAWPFSAASAPEIFPAFAEITSGMLDAGPFAQIEKLDTLFRRCDYIRYAHDGGEFTLTERFSLVNDARGTIVFFERGGE
jgi:hypothetical protein